MINDCPHSFIHLAQAVLPQYMKQLRQAMQSPRPLAELSRPGTGKKTMLKNFKKARDFPACYVFMDQYKKPLYVGITRKLAQRLWDHLRGSDHWTASLAHMMAIKNSSFHGTRRDAKADPAYQAAFATAKAELAKGLLAYIELENPLERYLFEVYAAMELDTCEWNSFDTH